MKLFSRLFFQTLVIKGGEGMLRRNYSLRRALLRRALRKLKGVRNA